MAEGGGLRVARAYVQVDAEDNTDAGRRSIGSSMTAWAGSLGLGAIIGKGIVDTLNIEAGNAKLQGQLGLTKGVAETAGKAAGSVYRDNFGGSMDEVNQAIKAVGTNLGDLSKMSQADIESMSKKALTLSSVFGVDVADSTKAVQKMISTGLAPDATAAFDIITRGMQTGADASGDFLDTLNEYSQYFSRLGIDGSTATGLISAGLKAGARDGDAVADVFKEFGLRAIDGSKGVTQAYKDIGLNAKTTAADIAAGGPAASAATQQVLQKLQAMKDPIKQNAAGVALFGTQWEDTLRTVLPKMDLTKVAVDGVKGSTDALAASAGDTAAAKIETLKRQVEGWTQSLVASDGAMGIAAAGMVTYGGSALGAAGDIGAAVSGLSGIGSKLAGAGKWFGGVISGAASAAASVAASAGTMIASAASAAAGTAASVARQVASWAVLAAQSIARAAMIAAAWLMANPFLLIAAAVVALVVLIVMNWDKILAFLKAVWEKIKAVAVAAWNGLVAFLRAGLTAYVTFWSTIWNKVWSFLTGIWSRIRTSVTAAWNGLVGWLRSALTAYVTFWVGIWNRIVSFVTTAMSNVRTRISSAISTIRGLWTAGWNAVSSFVSTAWGRIRTAVTNGISNVLGYVRALPGRISGALGNLGSLLYSKGADIVRGLWNGIKSMGGWLRDTLMGWARNMIPGPIAKALGIASPSKVAAQLGKWVPAGLAEGMLGNSGLVGNAATDLARMALPTIGPAEIPAARMGVPVGTGAAGSAASGAAGGTRVYRIEIGGKQFADLVVDAVTGQPKRIAQAVVEGNRQRTFYDSARAKG